MHNYTDAPLLPQLEHWRIVSRPRSDYVFVVWCGQVGRSAPLTVHLHAACRVQAAYPSFVVPPLSWCTLYTAPGIGQSVCVAPRAVRLVMSVTASGADTTAVL